jgi:hypothetical protein
VHFSRWRDWGPVEREFFNFTWGPMRKVPINENWSTSRFLHTTATDSCEECHPRVRAWGHNRRLYCTDLVRMVFNRNEASKPMERTGCWFSTMFEASKCLLRTMYPYEVLVLHPHEVHVIIAYTKHAKQLKEERSNIKQSSS